MTDSLIVMDANVAVKAVLPNPLQRHCLALVQTFVEVQPATASTLEPGYQIARLRIQRGLTQAQLAEMVGTRQPSIARLENGTSVPSLSFLDRIAKALDARIELHVVPRV
jgi:DNA-binding XRE family transcriptional regulator